MAEITLALVREMDRRMADFEKEFALHCQAMQFQIGNLAETIADLKKAKPAPAFGLQIIELLTSPRALKFLSGGALTAGGYLLSRLTG
jgi:hypothetical protein